MKLRVSPFHWLAEQETVGHDIILPGRSTSCSTFFTQVTHTLGRKWPLSTHTLLGKQPTSTRIHTHRHACKEMGHINGRLQECVQTQNTHSKTAINLK